MAVFTYWQYDVASMQAVISDKQAIISQEQNKIALFEKRYELYEFFSELKSAAGLLVDKGDISLLKEFKREKYDLSTQNDMLVSYIILVENFVPDIDKTHPNIGKDNQLELLLAKSTRILSETVTKAKLLFSLEYEDKYEIEAINSLLSDISFYLQMNPLKSSKEIEEKFFSLLDLLQKTALPDVMAKALRMAEVSQ